MNRWISILLLIAVSGSVFAGSKLHHRNTKKGIGDTDSLSNELENIFTEEKDTKIGDLTFEKLEELYGRISIPLQEAAFIQKSRAASFALPGVGQFINNEPLSGALFLTADIAVIAGTLVGAYLLLPSELQLDYLNTPKSQIKETWRAQSVLEMLPSAGIMIGGMLIQSGIRIIASKNAANLAKQNIEDGTITFEPLTFMASHGRRLGFGFRF